MAIGKSGTASGAWFTAILGTAQATGAILTLVGAVRYSRSRQQQAKRYNVAAAPTSDGGAVSFGMRF
jgi:hypothetical protein